MIMRFSNKTESKTNTGLQREQRCITEFCKHIPKGFYYRLNNASNGISSIPYVNKVYLYTDSVTTPPACTTV
jgi:hypothetical protein